MYRGCNCGMNSTRVAAVKSRNTKAASKFTDNVNNVAQKAEQVGNETKEFSNKIGTIFRVKPAPKHAAKPAPKRSARAKKIIVI